MFKQKIFFFLISFFFLLSFKNKAQIVASPTAGCFPQTISFTSPPGATAASWNFGDLGTSNLLNPGHSYVSAGNFTVVCNYTVAGTPSVATLVVPVFPKPTAAFSYTVPAIRCAPATVTFVNASTSPTTIVSYTWNLGNGTPTNVVSPIYAYPAGGSFTVNLTVLDANNCTGTVALGPINISNPPIVVINTNPAPASGCSVPFNVSFNGSGSQSGSPIPGPLGFSWTFPGGNPATSNASVPGNVTYNATGSYIASLTVTDNNNCSGGAAVPVNVSQATLNVTGASTACANALYTVNVQSNSGSTIQGPYVNDGSPFNNVTYTYTYGAPGTFTYAVTAGVFPCTATQIKTVVVTQVTAAITATPPSFSCGSPFICNYFNASSPNAVTYTWSTTNCGGGVPMISNLANPTFTFTQGSLNPYTIFPYCRPIITLMASSANGCIGTATIQADTLRRPTAWFNKNKKEGCAPLVVTYRDTSFAHPSPLAITGYTWNNGASPPTLSTGVAPPVPNATFTYNTPGTYTPYLIIQTIQGCIDTSFVDTITVVNPAPISFSFNPSTVCPGQTVQIVNTSPNQNLIKHWHVTSDNGFFSGCVSDPNPGWVFTHIGVHTFTLSAWKNSCQSTTTIPQTVTVRGPIVKSRFTTSCTNRFTVFFDTHLQDVANATINFGDASPPVNFPGVLNASSQHTINHTYANTGDYTVVVTATNGITGTCTPTSFTMLVQVRNIQANISLSPTACVNFNSVFSAASSTDVLIGCPNIGFTWYFDNAPPIVTSLTAVSYSFGAPGIHTVSLLVKDLNSCSSIVTNTIRISSAAPSFSAMPSNTICLSTQTVQFINSTSQTPDPITNYLWNFGNGVTSTFTGSPIGTYTSAAIPFSQYTVSLTATNALGCVATQTLLLQVNNPNAQLFAAPNNSICIGQSVVVAAPSGYTNYTLSLGDGSMVISPNFSVSHSYTAAGTYPASVTIIDANGCKSSSTLNFYVQSYPIADFIVTSPGAQFPNVACLGDVTFSSTSTSNPTYNLTYNWNAANGASLLPIPVVIVSYTNTGTFPVSMTVSTPFGCKSTLIKVVNIFGAKANLNLDKTSICLGETIKFNLKDTSTVFAWTWDFADGDTLKAYAPSLTQTVSHTYTNYPLPNGNATVSLIYYSSNHACKFFATQAINIVKIQSDFKRNNEISKKDSVHCLGVADTFSPITANPIFSNFNWNFGNGNSSNQQTPTYNFTLAGVYPVTLTVTDQASGCMGFAVKNITVNPAPDAAINARDTCQNASFPLSGFVTGNGPFTATWIPTQGVVNPNALNTSASASVSTEYTLRVKDVNGCLDSAIKNIQIQLPPKNIQWDTTVIIGQTIPMNGFAGSNMSYTWNPTINLNCPNCILPVSTTTDNFTYSVTVADNLGCFTTVNIYRIKVDPRATIDVPTAFTPNGDGVNDFIFPDGWGVKKVNYFRVYNRWGQLLFETDQFKVGWDGTYNGVPQNMETYIYQVSVETFLDKEALLKTGSFKLIR